MASRREQLSQLQEYIKEVDKDVTMILQSLQWDRKLLLQCKPKSTCKYDSNHKIPPEKLKEHEERCVLKSQGYVKDDVFLPDVFDPNSGTVLKLTSENIKEIINYASKTDPLFKRGDANVVSEPLTMERLQATYSADERRAIYDVVVNAGPSCQQLSDLSLAGNADGPSQSKHKSKLEQLAELRNLRRRRTKYRVSAPSRNYSNVLRELIEAQMDMYNEAHGHNKTNTRDDESSTKYRKDKEDQASKRGTDKHENIVQRERDRNIVDDNKRKRDHDKDRSSRTFERDRYHTATEEKRTYNDNNDKRKPSKNRDSYRDERDNRRYEKYGDKSTSLERSKNYNSQEERDRYNSSSRDRQRHRDSERDERYYKDRSTEKHRSDKKNEHKRYRDDSLYRKDKEYSHADKIKHKEY